LLRKIREEGKKKTKKAKKSWGPSLLRKAQKKRRVSGNATTGKAAVEF